MSGTIAGSAVGASQGTGGTSSARRGLALHPVGWVIVVATLLALALRVYQLARPGELFGVAWYDDGVYFGSAVRLVHGVPPYRDCNLTEQTQSGPTSTRPPPESGIIGPLRGRLGPTSCRWPGSFWSFP